MLRFLTNITFVISTPYVTQYVNRLWSVSKRCLILRNNVCLLTNITCLSHPFVLYHMIWWKKGQPTEYKTVPRVPKGSPVGDRWGIRPNPDWLQKSESIDQKSNILLPELLLTSASDSHLDYTTVTFCLSAHSLHFCFPG